MKIPNRGGLKIKIYHSPNHSFIDFKDFAKLKRKCTVKQNSFLVIDTSLASDNLLCFHWNLMEEAHSVIITFDEKLKRKKNSITFIERQQIHMHYHQV